MAWKKIILSGSQADLASVSVDSFVSASSYSGDGSNLTFAGTNIVSGSSQLDSVFLEIEGDGVISSSAQLANDFLEIQGDNVISGSGQVVASLLNQDVDFGTGNISGSNLKLTGDANIDGNIVLGGNINIGDQSTDNIIFGGEVSSSILPDADSEYDLGSTSKRWSTINGVNISGSGFSGSYFEGDGSKLTNITVSQAATVSSTFTAQTSVTVNHNFDSKNVDVTVYDSSDFMIVPASVQLTDDNTAVITFDSSTTGRVVVAKGGHIVSGSISADNIDGLNQAVVDALPTGTVSGSAQTIDNLAGSSVVSSSAQIDNLGFLQVTGDSVVSGSSQIDLTQTTNYLSGIKDVLDTEDVISGSVFSSPSQGTVRAIINGVTTDVDTGLQTSDSPEFNNLTVSGDLTVQGTTTTVQTSNLLVEDKFILLNSGSANPDEGGLIIDEGQGQGHAFVFDNTAVRFGFTGSLAQNATSVTPDAFIAAVVDIDDAGHTDKAEYQNNGNIKVESGEIFIYS